jgi:hypothetical protein
LNVVDHADVYSFGGDNPDGGRQALPWLGWVFVAPHRQHRSNGFQTIEDAQTLEVAAVEDQVNAGQGLQYLAGQVPTAACAMGI